MSWFKRNVTNVLDSLKVELTYEVSMQRRRDRLEEPRAGAVDMAMPSTSKQLSAQRTLRGHSLKTLCGNEIASILKPRRFDILQEAENRRVTRSRSLALKRTSSVNTSVQNDKENISTNIATGVLQQKDFEKQTTSRYITRTPKHVYMTRFRNTESNQFESNKQTDRPSISKDEPYSRSHLDVENIATQVPSSHIKPNLFSDLNLLKYGVVRRPKKIKKRVVKTRHVRLEPCSSPKYDEEYMDDILANNKETAKNVILPLDFLKEFNPLFQDRKILVNWLLDIGRQLMVTDSEFHLAINVLDRVLASSPVKQNRAKFVAAASLLIASKYNGGENNMLTVEDLLKPCDWKPYHEEELIEAEEIVLKIIEFRVHSIELTVFINLYLKKMQIDLISSAAASIYFILDCAIHLDHFSTVPPSISSAAALILAIKIFYPPLLPKVKDYFDETMSKEEIYTLRIFQLDILDQINHMKRDNIHKNILNKYKEYDWLSKIVSSRDLRAS